MNVLTVDDEAIVLFYIQTVLNQIKGVTYFEAFSVDEAIKIIKNEKLDLIITDLKMPKRDGFELIDEIYKLGLDIPIIVASGFLENNKKMKKYRDKVMAFLPKPLDFEHIENIVNQIKKSN